MDFCGFGEKERLHDLLNCEKHLTGEYNTFLTESATPEVITCLSDLLNSTHQMQEKLFGEMNSRGWYPVAKAEDAKVTSAKQKFVAFAAH